MEQTENLGLNLISNSAEDKQMKFSAWRAKIAGTGDDSNMKIIDAAVGDLQESVDGVMQDVESAMNDKADKTDTVLNTTLSMGRKAGTTVGRNSVAVGQTVEASGQAAHAEGSNTTASEAQAHAEGLNTTSSGVASHAEGEDTTASGDNSHAEGENTTASDDSAHAEGYHTTASGALSHAEGNNTVASGEGSHASGGGTIANASYMFAIGTMNKEAELYPGWVSGTTYNVGDKVSVNSRGYKCKTSNHDSEFSFNKWVLLPSNSDVVFVVGNGGEEGLKSNALVVKTDGSVEEGYNTSAVGAWSHAEGYEGLAAGKASHVEGYQLRGSNSYNGSTFTTGAIGDYSHAEGCYVSAIGANSHAEGLYSISIGENSHAEGRSTATPGYCSHAEGYETEATSQQAHAEGYYTDANGDNSHAEGYYSKATGVAAHAEGRSTESHGEASHAEGYYAKSTAQGSHAEGYYAQAHAQGAHAEGVSTQATKDGAHTEGYNSIASLEYAHAEGEQSGAHGRAAHAEGYQGLATKYGAHSEGYRSQNTIGSSGSSTGAHGIGAHSEGYSTSALGNGSHAEGGFTVAVGERSHAEGSDNTAVGDRSHAEGCYTTANQTAAHAEGYGPKATGRYSHAEGYYSEASNDESHAEGYYTKASGANAHAEGRHTIASGNNSHAEGEINNDDVTIGGTKYTTGASGTSSHTEGFNTCAIGNYTHAEGYSTVANGPKAHAEGYLTFASGESAHAEGGATRAEADYSHAEGGESQALGKYSHAEGNDTIARHMSQHVFGEYNIIDYSTAPANSRGTYVEIVGNGSSNHRSNARTLDWEGNEALAGDLKIKAGTSDEISVLQLAKAVKAYHGGIDDWSVFREIVRLGKAEDYAPVGTQISDTWEKTAGGTTYEAPWDVVHHGADGTYLEQHYATPDGVPFDEPEAIYYAAAGGLPAGTYHIDIGVKYGTGWVVGQAIQFTLANAMAEGDQLVVNCGTDNANNPTNGRAWNVYAKGSTTSKEHGTTANGTGGTSLGTIGATNAHTPSGQLNAVSRVVYGYNRWSQSAMRQYLNSTAAAGNWWISQNDWDRPPAVAATMRGWLAGCTEDFLNILEPVEIVTALNNFDSSGSVTTETTTDRIFLKSLQETYITPQLANVEGEDWDYYKTLAQEAGLSGKFAQGSTYPILISYRLDDHSSPVYVQLRSCGRASGHGVWTVNSGGNVNNYYAYPANRGRPACKISKS